MKSLISTLARAVFGPPPKLVCASNVWRSGVAELHRRTGGRRESGAFLLGRQLGETRRIEQFLFYDDVDPTCFNNGMVEFDGRKFGSVWERCRTLKMTVVADVHVHPAGYGQSQSDRENPMIAEVGHLAIILPNFAKGRAIPGRIGLYEYLGSRRWEDLSRKGSKLFRLEWWPS